MVLTIPIPDDLEETLRRTIGSDLNAYAREAMAVQLYRERKLHHKQFAQILGLDRWEAEEVLRRHGVVDITPQDLQREDQIVRQHLDL